MYQAVCEDTILSVLGDACNLLGISISEALSLLLECCDSTTQDFNGVFTVLEDIKDTLTECCTDILDTLTNCGIETHITQEMIPFTITQPGVYCLAANVTVAGGATGITISSSNVVLDLNFHRISGGATGILTSSSTLSNITIKNGYFLSQTNQAILLNSSINLIQNCLMTNLNGTGVVAANVLMQNTTIENCFIRTATGISFSGTLNQYLTVRNTRIFTVNGLAATIAADGVIFQNCAISSGTSSGLSFTSDASHVYVKDCQFTGCALSAIVSTATNTTIEDCNMVSNSTGVSLTAGGNNTVIKGCTVVNPTGGNGINIAGVNNVAVQDCTVLNHLGTGINITGGQDIAIDDCEFCDNGTSGIVSTAPSTAINHCVVNNNGSFGIALNSGADASTVKDCILAQNGGNDTIIVGAQNVVIENCQVLNNTLHGITLSGAGAQVLNCSAIANGGDGFRTEAAATISQMINNVATRNTGFGFNNNGNATNKFYKNFATANTAGNYSAGVPAALVYTPGTALVGDFSDIIGNTDD